MITKSCWARHWDSSRLHPRPKTKVENFEFCSIESAPIFSCSCYCCCCCFEVASLPRWCPSQDLSWEFVDAASRDIAPCESREISTRILDGRWNILESEAVGTAKPYPSSTRSLFLSIFFGRWQLSRGFYIFYSPAKKAKKWLKIFSLTTKNSLIISRGFFCMLWVI